MHFSRQSHCWSLRCSTSIAYRRCSNYIFILHLTFGFNILCKDNRKRRWESLKFWDLVHLILQILLYIQLEIHKGVFTMGASDVLVLKLKHQAISTHSANQLFTAWDNFMQNCYIYSQHINKWNHILKTITQLFKGQHYCTVYKICCNYTPLHYNILNYCKPWIINTDSNTVIWHSICWNNFTY